MVERKQVPSALAGKKQPPAVISPSILSADFADLANECNRMLSLGADWLHVDVMDGHFVPNLTLGPPIVASLRKRTAGFLDTHLMVSRPEEWLEPFVKAGVDMFTFHLESVSQGEHPEGDARVLDLIGKIHALGVNAGIAIKPGTAVESLFPYVAPGAPHRIDMALVMTVEPGFGGQKFMSSVMDKVRSLRDHAGPWLNIQVDGGLAPDTIGQAAEAGANVIVAGSAVFGAKEPGDVIRILREAVDARS